MSEFHAAVVLASFEDLEDRLAERLELEGAYRHALADVPGVSFPSVLPGDRSTVKDLTVLVDPRVFGRGPDALGSALASAGIETKRYYAPPVHSMQAYASLGPPENDLTVTNDIASRTLTLPLWSGMGVDRVEHVAHVIRRTQTEESEPRP
jgi:dTDP-4-amino-4,6-dideoxygalactose transaminase